MTQYHISFRSSPKNAVSSISENIELIDFYYLFRRNNFLTFISVRITLIDEVFDSFISLLLINESQEMRMTQINGTHF